jgi:hypothetical protein
MVFLLCSDNFRDYSPCVGAGQEPFFLFLYEFFLPTLRLVSDFWPVSVSMTPAAGMESPRSPTKPFGLTEN